MPSTWTLNNAIEKIADGEKTDTWGQITNRNFDILDRAVSGVGTIDLSSSAAAHTLYTTDGTVGDALTDGMYKVLVLSGATQACTITISPNDADKLYFVDNNSGQDCTFSQGTGANVTIANGSTGIIYADGAGSSAAVTAIIDSTTLSSLGITATAAELNKLDGATVTTAEINYNDITTLGTSQASKVVTADANGVVTFANGTITESTAITSSSNAATINLRDGDNFTHTLSEDVTYTFSNPSASGKVSAFTLKVTQDSSARSITWPSSVDWASATAPTLTTTSGGVDVFIFATYDGGSTYYGFTAGQAMG
tara:strand:+ start:239 stop:1171 length:933 start_codon:yes stop_codon:yes gene_type:complete